MPRKTAISALFLDFDGTISPLGVSRPKAQVSSALADVLQKIAEVVPVAVITTKDMRFIQERVPFASAWAAIGGIEIKIGDRILGPTQEISSPSSVEALLGRLEAKTRQIDESVCIERKTLSDGRVVAFCIDWRLTMDWELVRRRLEPLLKSVEEDGFTVLTYPGRPYADVYQDGADKGKALLTLRSELRINEPIMYLGDSEPDNSAFDLADISIGVLHSETPPSLRCEFFIQFNHIETFFRDLWRNRLVFDPKSQWIVRNRPRETG